MKRSSFIDTNKRDIRIGNLKVGEETEVPLVPKPAPDVNFKKTAAGETQYEGGAQRDNRVGKGAMHWVPWDAFFCVTRIYELGNKGRSSWRGTEKVPMGQGDGHDRNWENGMPILDLCQSAINHITNYIAGDRSEPHLPMAAWNIINAIQMSIWVYLGFRPKSLNRLPNHRGPWKPGMESPCPLSPQEIEWLKFRGVIPKD